MKKILIAILVMTLCICLFACAKDKDEVETTGTTVATEVTDTTPPAGDVTTDPGTEKPEETKPTPEKPKGEDDIWNDVTGGEGEEQDWSKRY